MAAHASRAIDKEFEEADDTGVLVLSGRNLRSFPNVPGDLCDLGDVFEADFSKNRFDRLPKEVMQFQSLTKLNCYHNNLRSIPEELYRLTNLKHLTLSRNLLQQIPSELCRMNLYSLNLSNNRLVSLPVELGKLSNLQFLDLSCNLLQELPSSFCELVSLQKLDLHRNELKDLPEEIFKLDQLTYLDISSNCLARLPIELKNLHLQTIVVADNPLDSPPMQICSRGFGHINKHLEYEAKRGSDSYLDKRDESLRRRKERVYKRNSSSSSRASSTTPVQNGKLNATNNSLLDEMASFVNQTFGNGGDSTIHWSIQQHLSSTPTSSSERPLSDQSKEDYREAAHRLYMQQERQKGKMKSRRSASPPADLASSESKYSNTLPKRKTSDTTTTGTSGVSESGGADKGSGKAMRMLPGEKQRSGSWNTHNRISTSVLPNKYSLTPETQRQRSDDGSKDSQVKLRPLPVTSKQSRSATDLHHVVALPDKTFPTKSPEKKKNVPPPESAKSDNGDRGVKSGSGNGDSDREGSITPTNETPPNEEVLDEPTTPKTKNSNSVDDIIKAAVKELKSSPKTKPKSSSAHNLTTLSTDHKEKEKSSNKPEPIVIAPSIVTTTESDSGNVPDIEIRELEGSPTTLKKKRRQPSTPDSNSSSQSPSSSPDPSLSPSAAADAGWPRLTSPRRRKEKDVFKFLKESDPNYTIKRQQMQMNIILEKNKHVKKGIETLMGIQLPDDIGEWVCDGIILCEIMNKLHPGLIANISKPPPGEPISRLKRTVNVSSFIGACVKLKIPQELLCSAGDIIELKDPVRVITCLQRVLETKPGNLI